MTDRNDSLHKALEEVPYPGFADPWSHVRCLEALARLHAVEPADITACRVLELGCASGRNLLPQAAEYSSSQFVGVDFSADQIAEGCADVKALSMENVELRNERIENIDASWGHFDYILCPGVFSWVPPETRQQVLSVCRENLAPHGVAVVSYNAYPGWHFQHVVRDLLRYHVAPFSNRSRQISEARSILEFVADNCPPQSVHGRVFHSERDYLHTVRDDYLFHEYLVEENSPLYFHQFAAQAEREGLQFVSDAEFSKMSAAFLSAEVQRVIANTPLVQRCQLLDYLHNESFHRTLLCHSDVRLQRTWTPETMLPFHVALTARPKPVEMDVQTLDPVELQFPRGKLTISQPLGKAAMKHLVDSYPNSVSIPDLHAAVLAVLPAETPTPGTRAANGVDPLAAAMLGAFSAGLIKLTIRPFSSCPEIGERPLATPLNRHWAARRSLLTNSLHEDVLLNDLQCYLLAQLDGSRDRRALRMEARQAAESGEFTCGADDGPIEQMVDKTLSDFCTRGLLVS